MDRNQAYDILRNCFPRAVNVKIINNEVEDGQRHFTSDVTRFVVEYEENHETKRSHVAIKAPITSPAQALLCKKYQIFEKEIGIYEKVMPRINKYLDKSLAPAHLHTTDSKILVLEDLNARGYDSGEKLPLLDFRQAKGVMKAYAHFHAASHRLYKDDPNILENVLCQFVDGMYFGKIVTPWGSVTLELLKRKNKTELIPKIGAAISFFQRDPGLIKAEVVDRSKFKFIALNHGDGRKDNFLFKNGADNEVQVQFVDYQRCFWSSPAYDIIYFLNTSVSADVLEAHFDDLVDEYLHELNARLKKLECGSTYERADFDKDTIALKFFILFSFFTLCALVSPLNRQQLKDAVIQMQKDVSDTCDLCLNDERFVSIADGWLKYFEKSDIASQF